MVVGHTDLISCLIDVQDLIVALGEPLCSGADSGLLSSPGDIYMDSGPERVSYWGISGLFLAGCLAVTPTVLRTTLLGISLYKPLQRNFTLKTSKLTLKGWHSI